MFAPQPLGAQVGDCAACGLTGATTYHWTQIDNIRRDPFEMSVGEDVKSLTAMGGALAAPSTAYIYDWNLLPIGQLLWLKELESYQAFPPMQDPASYNLSSILKMVKDTRAVSHAGD
jgi:hypothetical protein